MNEEGPRRISDKKISIDVTDHLTPWKNGQALFLGMPGTDDLFVLVFSTIDKLKATCSEYGLAYDSIKTITDGREFLDSVIIHARVAVDPYKHENGRMRWVEPISYGVEA